MPARRCLRVCLLDRFGSKALILVGAGLMASGQLVVAFTESLPGARGVLGLGDALTLISVLRLAPHWFSSRQVPLVTQLTGICGQLGQVLSAVPFFGLLTDAGWTVAYVSVAAIGVLSMMLTLALVKNTPNGRTEPTQTTSIRETLAVSRRCGCARGRDSASSPIWAPNSPSRCSR
jgi:MFS family permease